MAAWTPASTRCPRAPSPSWRPRRPPAGPPPSRARRHPLRSGSARPRSTVAPAPWRPRARATFGSSGRAGGDRPASSPSSSSARGRSPRARPPRHAVGDRSLDAREPLEQLLALLQRFEQALVELRLALRLVALAALLARQPEQAQRQTEHARHPAREMELVDGESRFGAAGDDEAGRRLVLDRDRKGVAFAEAGDHDHCAGALGDLAEHALERGIGGEADRGDDLAAAQQRGHLGVERLGRPLDGEPGRGALVLSRGDAGEKAGELAASTSSGRRRGRPAAMVSGTSAGGGSGQEPVPTTSTSCART